MSNLKEEWRDIKDYKGIYQVSNLGRIKNYKTKKIRKIIYKSNDNYGRVILSKNGKIKGEYIHRLVAKAFLENPNNYKEINHKDENPTNNNLMNLEWCDRKYNNLYGKRIKKVKEKLSKPINQYDLQGNFIKKWGSISSAMNEYHNSHIVDCLKQRRKTAGGCIWKYADEKGEKDE